MKSKLLALAIILVLLIGALAQISGVVQDRQNHRQAAIHSIAQSLAGAQTLVGPLIHVTCTEQWSTVVDKQVQTERREHQLVAAPTSLAVQGSSQLQPRARGLHATQVFDLKARLAARWADLQTLQPTAQHPNGSVSCGQPVLMMSVTDARGIRHASLRVGDTPLPLLPGTLYNGYPRGVHAPLPTNLLTAGGLAAQLDIELVGTEQLSVVPVGADTQVNLSSNWPHPSFGGQFLPVTHQVSAQGFEASWRVSSLASTAQQDVAQRKAVCATVQDASTPGPRTCAEAFGVTFVDPGNTYALSDRATKYGLLFIGLTFLAVGLFEFMKALRVHPIQYLLVGAAMSMFFLLLVSLAEHLPFEIAYLAAASACVLLLTFYAGHMLQGFSRGVPFGLGIGLLYGMLYVLLQIEQTALLVGTVALFAVLAAIMALTRHVDWYARIRQMSQGGAAPG
ncbi:cell envelope integrity protein CreD [Rhodoferax sp.]|uniref:cell envelope integrity protein CreD n=1 Tax=Rhodoferax sp. TaxID=50421 RepID=UPI002746090C|nr:cell envelope integrity protein CreD [Rhodoferax sp.]